MMIGEVLYKIRNYILILILSQVSSLAQNVLPNKVLNFNNKYVDYVIAENTIISVIDSNKFISLNVYDYEIELLNYKVDLNNINSCSITFDSINKIAYLAVGLKDTLKILSFNLENKLFTVLNTILIVNLNNLKFIKSNDYNNFYVSGTTDSLGFLLHINVSAQSQKFLYAKDAIFTPYRDIIFLGNSIVGIKRGDIDNQNNLNLSLFLDQINDSLKIYKTVEILTDTTNYYFNQTGSIIYFENKIIAHTICKNKFAEEYLLIELFDENLNSLGFNLNKLDESSVNYILNNNIFTNNKSIYSFTTSLKTDNTNNYSLVINNFNASGELKDSKYLYLFESANWGLGKVYLQSDKIIVAAFEKSSNSNHKIIIYKLNDINNSLQNEIEFSTFSIYPNPINSEYLYVNLNKKNRYKDIEIIILNSFGEIISKNILNIDNSISVSNLKNGIYIIGVSVDGIISYKKLLKL